MEGKVLRGEADVGLGFFPILNPAGGGVYQYSMLMAHALAAPSEGTPVLAVVPTGARVPDAFPLSERIELDLDGARPRFGFVGLPRARKTLRRIRRVMTSTEPIDLDVIRRRPHLARVLREVGVELMVFPAPDPISFEIGLPYVAAIHDLQHRLQPEFPEVSADGEWERREHMFRNVIRNASAVIAESTVGREHILEAYAPHGLEEDRVFILPYVASHDLMATVDDTLRVRRTYCLPERYLFYPAQFWPHKNHLRLFEALALLRDQGVRVDVVLAGSWSGALRDRTFRESMQRARQREVDDQVTVLGYVPQRDMGGLYRAAAGLVFPTFFGPTNIPVLEAWALDCPVITSDIRGIREQVGDAALVVDPRQPEAIASAIERLWTDTSLRRQLVEKGRERAARHSPDDFRGALVEILERARSLGPPAIALADGELA
jgi:glycosyltransferase involved in cell wall biosynthesis